MFALKEWYGHTLRGDDREPVRIVTMCSGAVVSNQPKIQNALAEMGASRGTATLGTFTRAPPACLVAMANGTVDFFNHTGGYGFISTDDSDDDVFFHMEDVGGPDLEEGTDIEFDIEQAPKGPRATNVVRA